MQVFASTTSMGTGRSDLPDALTNMRELEIDGLEIGSTHVWRPDFEDCLLNHWNGLLFTHNYFPPARKELILNIGSADPQKRRESINHAKACIRFAAKVGAKTYTVHAGFIAEVTSAAEHRGANVFDFDFAPERNDRGIAVAYIVDALNKLMNAAQKCGVTLAVETEGSLTSPNVFAFETIDAYEDLLARVPGLALNFNLAHSGLAATAHGFRLEDFISRLGRHFIACEISHNDGFHDSHAPLEPDCKALEWIQYLPQVPLILEFREATLDDMRRSIELVRKVR